MSQSIIQVKADYIATIDDGANNYFINAISSDILFTLPDITDIDGLYINIYRIDKNDYTVRIKSTTKNKIRNSTKTFIMDNNTYLNLLSFKSNWISYEIDNINSSNNFISNELTKLNNKPSYSFLYRQNNDLDYISTKDLNIKSGSTFIFSGSNITPITNINIIMSATNLNTKCYIELFDCTNNTSILKLYETVGNTKKIFSSTLSNLPKNKCIFELLYAKIESENDDEIRLYSMTLE